AVGADESLSQNGLVDDAQDRAAVLFQRDQATPFVSSGDKAAGAIDGIEHPAQSAGARLLAMLLAQDAVLGTLPVDDGADGGLGILVRLGDGIEHRLAVKNGALVRHIDTPA